MSVGNELDINTLSWVKSEIDETLNQARTALEAYVENPDDESRLQFCFNYLHQVRGTLQMVELYGATMAAEEMEILTQALLDKQVNNREDAYEVLMRGILQLPDYLEHLLAGHQDIPVVLMPLLNDLRAARGEALLSENALFTPDLTVDAPTNEMMATDIIELARKLRHNYHLGLLGWFRDKDSEASLKRIGDVIEKLRQAAGEQEINRLLWVAGGLVESLKHGGLDSSVSIKLLLGQLDRQIKKIIDNGITALSDEPPLELLKNLLYYVATSQSSDERTREVKNAFKLDQVMPDTHTLEQARADLTGPNAALMGTVSSVLLEDLTRVKDTLDVFMRKEERDSAELKPLCDTLNQMADTLGMMGLGLQRRMIQDQIDVLRAMVNGERELEESNLMDVAGAMLSLEASLQEASVARAANEEAEEVGEAGEAQQKLREAEQQQLLRTVIEQAGDELAHVKDALNDFSRNTASAEVLQGIPATLDQIRGSLAILDLERAARLLDRCNHYVRTELLEKRSVPEDDALNAFADAVSSIEYYLESLAGKWGHPETILDIAEKSLHSLDEYIQSGTPVTREHAAGEQEAEAPDIDLSSMELIMPSSDEEDTHLDLQAPDDDTLQNLVTPAVVDETEFSNEPVSDEEDTLTDISTSSVLDSRQDLIGPEDSDATRILDVSELSLEGQAVGLEPEQPESPPASTVKQSSEPVTLQDLPSPGEDSNSPKSNEPPVDNALSLELDGFDENPTMVLDKNALQQVEDGLNFDIEPPVQQDENVSLEIEGLELEDASDMPAAIEEETAAVTATPDLTNESSSSISSVIEPPDEIDDEIIEIFLEEAEEEYQNIGRLLSQWEADISDDHALKDMRRSFHTLKGSGRLVGAKDLGEFAWAFENMLNRVIDKTVEVSPLMFEVLHHGRDTLPQLFELFKTGIRADQSVLALMSAADDLSQGKEVKWTVAESADQPTTDEKISVTEESLPETVAPGPVATENVTETVEPFTPEAEEEDFDLSLDEEAWNEVSEASGAATPLPDIDPVLLDIYRKEVETHLNTLRQFLAGWHANIDRSANDNVLRALHTLTGSSRTTGVQQVSEVCSQFEQYVKSHQKNTTSVSAEAVTVLEQTIQYIENTTALLDQPGVVIASNTELLHSVESLSEGATDETPSMEIIVEETGLDEIEATSEESAAETTDVKSVEQPATVALAPRDYDEELLEIFIEEGEEILEESDQALTRWMENTADAEALEALQRHLHTLKGGARMAGVLEIGDLGHSIESMLTAVVDGRLLVTNSLFAVLQQAQDRLVHLLEQVKANQGLAQADDIIVQVDELLGRSSLGKDVSLASNSQIEPAIDEITDKPPPEGLQTGTDATLDEPDLATELEALANALQFDDTPAAAESNSTAELDAELPDDEFVPESSLIQSKESIEVSEVPSARTDTDNVVELKTQRASEAEAEKSAITTDEDQAPLQDRRKTPRVQHEQVRVRADLLDNLVNFAGEVSIYRSRMEQQTNSFRYNLRELDETVSRLRNQLRAFEIETEAQIQYRQEETLSQAHDDFDPLEFDRFTHMQQLSRGMLESLSDLDSLRAILANITRESETLLLQQSRVNTELQEGLMRTRMVPFAGQAPRLRRIVRQTSSELGKNVELKLLGMEGELDRTVLDRVISPIEHMLRNAIAHGIETPAQRREQGKPETGSINLSFKREGSDIVIQVSDDGAGINLEAIQKKAIEKGLLKPGSKVAKDVLLNMIMESGFSTAEQVTQVAGRGVGMDVVNTEIKQLGGLLSIDTEGGKGTTFTINMPLTLAITRALMVNVGEENYAIPLLSVHGVERISAEELQALQVQEQPVYHWLDEDYPLMHLGTVLGINKPLPPAENQKVPLLLVRSGEYRAAIQVEGMLGSREIVVKPIGPQLSTLSGITGATIMGDGQVMLILDLGVLIRLMSTTEGEDVIEVRAEPEEKAQTKPIVMVVDDSITVRKVTTRLLERNDYEVVTAKDGVDALSQLQEHRPDIMLLDVEMPRMDGFELATNIRNDAELKDMPIIMITSRTASKHQQRAMDIGVNAYMGKPYNESDLLKNIENLVSN